jgi:hypothetical protein
VHTIAARLGAMRRDGVATNASDLTVLQETLSRAPDTLGQALAAVLSVIMQTPVAVVRSGNAAAPAPVSNSAKAGI